MNAFKIQTINNVPRILDTDLASGHGHARPTAIRRVVRANREQLETYGPLVPVSHTDAKQAGHYLTAMQAGLIMNRSRAKGCTFESSLEMMSAFDAQWRKIMQTAQPSIFGPSDPSYVLWSAADEVEAAAMLKDEVAMIAEAAATSEILLGNVQPR